MTSSPFIWYELMTSDPAAALEFYAAVVGWSGEPFGGAEMPYTVLNAGGIGVAGLMAIPPEVAAAGARPVWMGYIHAADVDAACDALAADGGSLHHAPTDIPDVGRFAVVADPQGAHFMLMAPQGPEGPRAEPSSPGQVGWRELYAQDWRAALDFYARRFGWSARESFDIGPMGTYQLFQSGDGQQGGMMTKPDAFPQPFWLFYFNVPTIDAAISRVKDSGGQVLMGPSEVPGGSWIVQCLDPQGAMFALTAPVR